MIVLPGPISLTHPPHRDEGAGRGWGSRKEPGSGIVAVPRFGTGVSLFDEVQQAGNQFIRRIEMMGHRVLFASILLVKPGGSS